ncbi:hypothetical protein [Mucilaginibacter celer]|nr:hypothetical protein [Mucilaginibacter celer]
MKIATTSQRNNTAPKSKIYAKYEKLLAEIEKQKQFKINMAEGLQKAYTKIEHDLLPLEDEAQLLMRDFLIRVDELATQIGVGKYNEEYLVNYMGNELDSLLDIFGHQDAVLSKLHEKYTGYSLDELAADDDAVGLAKSISELVGVDIDVKEMLKKGQEAYFEEFREKFAEQINSRREDFFNNLDTEAENKKKKPGTKKVSDETADIAKDARGIYMRLIKKFHPDLERDAELKEQKTEIVKQVTKAYQENDFFTLLKLQLTHIDDNETDVAARADNMLKHYIKLLESQLLELNQSIHQIHYSNGTTVADFIDKNGKFSPQKFSAQRRRAEKQINQLKTALADSKKRPKGWFKEQMSMIKDIVMQHMMHDMFGDMFNNFR